MKKSLILVGLLSIGYAHAQEGRVGINTETPTATLNVKSNVDNGKNLELENRSGTKLVTVLDNGYVGINNATPKAPLHIVSPNIGYGNDIIIEDYNNRSIGGDPSGLIFNRNRGTLISPEKLNLDDIVGQIIFSTKGGTNHFATYRMSEIGSFYKGENKGDFYIKTSGEYRLRIDENGNIGMGVYNPTNKLHVRADASPVRLEGLQASTVATDKVVVVDATGVLKTVERSSIGGGTQGITQEADGVIGNEVSGVITGGGLKVDGSGTKESPLKVGVAEGGITTGMLAANSVDAGKIAPNAVTGDKIANATIGADKLNIPGQADQVLTYKDGKWVAADAKGLTAGVNKGDTLVWNGTSWVTKSYKVVRTDATSYTVTDQDLIVSTTTQPNFNVTLPTGDNLYVGRKVCVFVKDGNATGHFTPTPPGSYGYIGGTISNCVVWDGEEWIPVVGG